MNYILIVDDEIEILEIMELSIQMVSSGQIRSASSGQSAVKIIEDFGPPILIISDYRMPQGDGAFLYKKVQEICPQVPFAICSGNPPDELKKVFPAKVDILSKPQFLKPVKDLVAKFADTSHSQVDYVPVPVGFLLRLGVVNVDAYIRLSENKYVKVHSKGDCFDKDDADKLLRKSLNHLVVTKADATLMAEAFESFLIQKRSIDNADTSAPIQKDVLETTTAFSKALGWNEETVRMASHAADLTIKMLSKDKDWLKLLNQNHSSSDNSHHITLLSMMVCVCATGIGWHSEATQQKLVMAAMLHDAVLDEKMYDLFFNSPEKLLKDNAYLQHPIKSAEFARTFKKLPSDVDTIILQHHERPDGSGFPRGLAGQHISAMSALFIICEELVLFSRGKKIDEELVSRFWETNKIFLEKDPFKKIAHSMIGKAEHA